MTNHILKLPTNLIQLNHFNREGIANTTNMDFIQFRKRINNCISVNTLQDGEFIGADDLIMVLYHHKQMNLFFTKSIIFMLMSLKGLERDKFLVTLFENAQVVSIDHAGFIQILA